MISVIVEDSPRFLVISNKGICPECHRSIATFCRKGESAKRVRWHRSDSGSGTLENPIAFRKCIGSGQPEEL